MNPQLSIIIPTYNRCDFLFDIAIKSVLCQKFKNWELIIVDDGSTDNTKDLTLELIKKNPSIKIKYFFQENKGQGAARNLGIKEAVGQYILCLDSDDYILPEMTQILINNFYPEYSYITCKNWTYNLKKGIFNVAGPSPSSTIFKKSAFYKFGFFDESDEIRGVEDWDLIIAWKIIEIQKNIKILSKHINQPLVLYLRHPGQESGHDNLAALKNKTLALLQKWGINRYFDQKSLSSLLWQTGNFYILLNKPKIGRKYLKKSIMVKLNIQAYLLLIISCLKNGTYKTIIDIYKFLRKYIIYKYRVKCYKIKFTNLYTKATFIVGNIATHKHHNGNNT
jgi:glycosyltransferase involved in cell wall biosynthesis